MYILVCLGVQTSTDYNADFIPTTPNAAPPFSPFSHSSVNFPFLFFTSDPIFEGNISRRMPSALEKPTPQSLRGLTSLRSPISPSYLTPGAPSGFIMLSSSQRA